MICNLGGVAPGGRRLDSRPVKRGPALAQGIEGSLRAVFPSKVVYILLASMSTFCQHWVVNVISKNGLEDLLNGRSSDAAEESRAWFKAARAAEWHSLPEVRQSFPDAG